MADLKLIKTKDISKVPCKANQLIFVDDGSMYFDYSSTLRLHNSGGAHLENFRAGREYIKYDLCVYQGILYRAIVDCCDSTFKKSHWQMLVSGSGEGAVSGDASNIGYESDSSGLLATTVQQAIDELVELNENAVSQAQQAFQLATDSKAAITELQEVALTDSTIFELDTF